jgi:hypothetical protein
MRGHFCRYCNFIPSPFTRGGQGAPGLHRRSHRLHAFTVGITENFDVAISIHLHNGKVGSGVAIAGSYLKWYANIEREHVQIKGVSRAAPIGIICHAQKLGCFCLGTRESLLKVHCCSRRERRRTSMTPRFHDVDPSLPALNDMCGYRRRFHRTSLPQGSGDHRDEDGKQGPHHGKFVTEFVLRVATLGHPVVANAGRWLLGQNLVAKALVTNCYYY